MSVSTNIKRFREEQGFSVRGLARASGVSQPYLRQLEKEAQKNPSGAILQKLATTLGVTVADLIGSPLEISGAALAEIPKSLRELVKKRGRQLGLRQEDVEMLRQIHYRGRQPENLEDWELLFCFIKRLMN